MTSCMEWHLPVQEEADWLRQFLFENKVYNIAKRPTRMQLSSFAPFSISPASKSGSARPILIV